MKEKLDNLKAKIALRAVAASAVLVPLAVIAAEFDGKRPNHNETVLRDAAA